MTLTRWTRYANTWQRVQGHAADVQSLLRSVEPHFRGELVRNLAQFERDVRQFCADYRHQGPMSPGLEPREASDRMQLFQVRLETKMWVLKENIP